MQLASGTLLHGGTYRIEKTLGQGSFGITYLAVHASLGRKVAIKEFFMKELNSRGEDGSITGMSDGSLSYNYGQKFKKEAMNLSQLDHPNIVRVTDSFEENGTYYYVMDYIEGENLNDYLKHNTISQEEAVTIITAVAKALQYMHDEKHILHLDLKPGNIMRRSNDGHIFLIDFGLSKHYSSTGQPETSTTIGLGTPGYAPIEQSNQAKSGEFRPTIDVYALGATLFKLLTRETPPPASDIVSDDELIEGKLRANGITGNIIDVVVNAMLPNVKKRTQTISAFLWMLTATPVTDKNIQSKRSQTEQNSTDFADIHGVTNEETVVYSNNEQTVVISEKIEEASTPFDWKTFANKKEYTTSPTYTKTKAAQGDPDYMLALAYFQLSGNIFGIPKNLNESHTLLLSLVKRQDPRAGIALKVWMEERDKVTKNEVHQPSPKPKSNNDTNDSSTAVGWFIFVVFVFVVILIAANANSCSNTNNYQDNNYSDSVVCDSICLDSIVVAEEEVVPTKEIVKSQNNIENNYKAINLGLPSGTKWSDRNVDAKSPEDYGGLFPYGNPWATLKKNDGYYNIPNIIGTSNDVAMTKMGKNWRTPSLNQLEELLNNCDITLINYNGKRVAKFVGPNGNSIVLPLTGVMYNYGRSQAGYFGMYEAGELTPDGHVYELQLWSEGRFEIKDYSMPGWGNPVRGVCM